MNRNTRRRNAGVEQRGAPVAANKTLKAIRTFLRWCVGRAVLEQSPAEGIPLPTREVARDRVLNDDELARVIIAARQIGGPYGGIVELLALTATAPSFFRSWFGWHLQDSDAGNGRHARSPLMPTW